MTLLKNIAGVTLVALFLFGGIVTAEAEAVVLNDTTVLQGKWSGTFVSVKKSSGTERANFVTTLSIKGSKASFKMSNAKGTAWESDISISDGKPVIGIEGRGKQTFTLTREGDFYVLNVAYENTFKGEARVSTFTFKKKAVGEQSANVNGSGQLPGTYKGVLVARNPTSGWSEKSEVILTILDNKGSFVLTPPNRNSYSWETGVTINDEGIIMGFHQEPRVFTHSSKSLNTKYKRDTDHGEVIYDLSVTKEGK